MTSFYICPERRNCIQLSSYKKGGNWETLDSWLQATAERTRDHGKNGSTARPRNQLELWRSFWTIKRIWKLPANSRAMRSRHGVGLCLLFSIVLGINSFYSGHFTSSTNFTTTTKQHPTPGETNLGRRPADSAGSACTSTPWLTWTDLNRSLATAACKLPVAKLCQKHG